MENGVVLKVLDGFKDLRRENREHSLKRPGRQQTSFAGPPEILAGTQQDGASAGKTVMQADLEQIEGTVLEKI